jgi:hypothetical protein
VLERPLHTERLTLRPATAGDADSTWTFRQLESVNEWLTGCRADLDAYPKLFSETARLTTTVIVTLGHEARDTQALHREKGGLRAPALLRRQLGSLAAAHERRA